MKAKTIILLCTYLFCLTSCDRPECTNTNAIFDSNSLESSAYKQELVNEMNRIGEENLTYWFFAYSEYNGEEFITVNIQGDGLCAKGWLEVKEWKNIEGIRRNKGDSYRGAQLAGLTFDIVKSGDNVNLVYRDLDSIID